MEKFVDIALRDKKIPKIFFLSGMVFVAALTAILWIDFDSVAYLVLNILLLVFWLGMSVGALYLWILPETAVQATDEGIAIHYLRKSLFFTFEELEYASHKDSNSRYHSNRSIKSAFLHKHREENGIGTLYIVTKGEIGCKTVALHGIIQASFAARWITEEAKKRKSK